MMHWFLQRKMCSERNVFYHSSAPQSFAQGVACDRHQVILVIVFAIATGKLLLLAAALGSLSH